MLLFAAAQSQPRYLCEGWVWQKHSPCFLLCREDEARGADLQHHRKAVLGSSLSFSGLGGSVWPSTCNLITCLCWGLQGSSAPPVQHVQLKPGYAESPLGLEKLVPGDRSSQAAVQPVIQHPDQRLHLGSWFPCPSAVTLQLLDSAWPWKRV